MTNNIRTIYLYIVSFITLGMIVGGIASIVNNVTSYYYPESYIFFSEDSSNSDYIYDYSESNEIVPMYNENSKVSNTEENDTSGGTRKIQETDVQKEIIYQEDNGEKTPITQKVVQPKVEGAIVTAKGASDAAVKTSIIQAVEAVTGLATHKIQVFEMN